jgi:hypothetical protein
MSSVGYERQQSARCVCTGAGVLRSRAPFRSGGGVDERPACEASWFRGGHAPVSWRRRGRCCQAGLRD